MTAVAVPVFEAAPSRVPSVLRWIANIVVDAVLVLWLAATLTFVTLKLLPGDPVDRLLAGVYDITPEMRAQVAGYYGLDQPLWVQYLQYIGRLATGDLGTSYQQQAPVTGIILAELPATLALTTVAMALAILVALVAVPFTAGRNRTARLIAQGVELLAISTPSFWLGILLMTLFAFTWPILPPFGSDQPLSIVLPALTLAIPIGGVLGQVLRERMEHVLHEPFVTTVRARGVGETALRTRHLLRHASLPALTLSGVIYGSLLSGTAIVETLFGRPGIGRIAVVAIQERDLPVAIGVVLFSAVGFILINTIVDLLYPLLDPRLRRS